MKGEKYIADVYNAIRSNPELWNSSLLVIFFDEHGGFYDHVTPPGAMAPDDHQKEYTFDQLGVRVPALLVSPWVSRMVDHTQFDHTSVLKYLMEKWGLSDMGRRTAAATSNAGSRCANRRRGPTRFRSYGFPIRTCWRSIRNGRRGTTAITTRRCRYSRSTCKASWEDCRR